MKVFVKMKKQLRGHHMLNATSIIIIAMFLFSAGCGKSNRTEKRNLKESPEYSQVATTSSRLLSGVLNEGYVVVSDVYTTRSKDYKKVYFVGAIVSRDEKKYKCIWTSNNIDPNAYSCTMFSINDDAITASGLGDGRSNRHPISQNDDGYSRIMDRLEQIR